jgi:hypothetical protein
MARRTKIEDLPVPEKELTEEEASKVKGGGITLTMGPIKITHRLPDGTTGVEDEGVGMSYPD